MRETTREAVEFGCAGRMAALVLFTILAASSCAPSDSPLVQQARKSLDDAWNGGPSLQVLTLSLIGDYPGLAEGRQRIEQSLASPSFQLKVEAAHALERWSDPDAAPLLLPLLEDANPLVQRVAARALAKMGRSEGRSILESAVRDAEEVLDVEICSALAKIGSEACVPEAERDVTKKNPALASAAAIVLGEHGGERAQRALRAALQAQRAERRAPVIEALGEAGEPSVDVAAIQRYARYKENVLAVVRALGDLGGERAVTELREFAGTDDPLVRAEACLALVDLGVLDDGVQSGLEQALADERTELRFLLAKRLSAAPDAVDVTPLLSRLVADEDAQVCQQAMTGLAARADQSLLPVVSEVWTKHKADDDGPGYYAALQALVAARKLRGEAADKLLDEALKSQNWGHNVQAALSVLSRRAESSAEAGKQAGLAGGSDAPSERRA
ncbi:MAG: HEAT repeat domain-containing protein [Acidobacteriota bacterium]|nr:MAG: HEAT repeat domain-containing protein [Acidobacteriota bacterium]